MALLGLGIVVYIVLIILLLIFIALPLNLAARMLNEDDELIKALGTTILLIIILLGCLELLPGPLVGLLVAFILHLALIKLIYDTTWGTAVVMWIVAIVMAIVISIIITVVFGVALIFL